MDENLRGTKCGRFGAVKHVYPAPVMAELVADYLETGATNPEVFVADFA